MWRWATIGALAAGLLSGCVRPPERLSGAFAEITVPQAQQRQESGQRVRWGGSIVVVTPGKEQTCFEVVSRPLDRAARPRQSDESDGRFLACAAGFYDPAVYAAGREITVVGTLQPPTTGKIGDYEYRYAKVAAETIYLWPARSAEAHVYYYDPWFDSYWYPLWGPRPWGPYSWGPWGIYP